jgi:hypothetical protein
MIGRIARLVRVWRATSRRTLRGSSGDEAAQPMDPAATKDTPDAPADDDTVADAARRIGVDRMSAGALIAFVAEHRRTDPRGAEAAMRVLERRPGPGRLDACGGGTARCNGTGEGEA